jgi:hypothetical protein
VALYEPEPPEPAIKTMAIRATIYGHRPSHATVPEESPPDVGDSLIIKLWPNTRMLVLDVCSFTEEKEAFMLTAFSFPLDSIIV